MFYFLRFYAKLFHFAQTTASPICKTTFPKWQQLRAATSPLLGSVPWRRSSRVEMGARRWIWERIGSFCERVQEVELRVSLSLCNHREIQMSKAAIPLHIELGDIENASCETKEREQELLHSVCFPYFFFTWLLSHSDCNMGRVKHLITLTFHNLL